MPVQFDDKAKLIATANGGVCIPPERADVQVLVGDDGVWLGLFGSDGKITMLNLADPSDLLVKSITRAVALREWADDRRRQVQMPG